MKPWRLAALSLVTLGAVVAVLWAGTHWVKGWSNGTRDSLLAVVQVFAVLASVVTVALAAVSATASSRASRDALAAAKDARAAFGGTTDFRDTLNAEIGEDQVAADPTHAPLVLWLNAARDVTDIEVTIVGPTLPKIVDRQSGPARNRIVFSGIVIDTTQDGRATVTVECTDPQYNTRYRGEGGVNWNEEGFAGGIGPGWAVVET